jgi:hypothetical protein
VRPGESPLLSRRCNRSSALGSLRKKPAAGKVVVKGVRDENAKDLFEMGEWAKNDVTMERVGKSLLVYSFNKDGQQSRGDRIDDKISIVAAGQTFRVVLHDHMCVLSLCVRWLCVPM